MPLERVGIVGRMAPVDAVQLRGGPCDGERPEPASGTSFPDSLDRITVMDHSAGVGHAYLVTDDRFTDDDGIRRTAFDFRGTAERGS